MVHSPPYGPPYGLPNSYSIAKSDSDSDSDVVLKSLDRLALGLWLQKTCRLRFAQLPSKNAEANYLPTTAELKIVRRPQTARAEGRAA
jgi:hypothetical protein